MARQEGFTIPLTAKLDGDRATIFKLEDLWYYCYRRVDSEGEEFEDEVVGPFTTADEAEKKAHEDYIPHVDEQ
jgi:hypothetical protein